MPDDAHDKVVRLDVEPAPVPERPATPLGRLHTIGIGGMALCAFLGIFSTLALITVRWPGESGRYVMATVIGSVVGFMAFASVAVAGAARPPRSHPSGDPAERAEDEGSADT